MAHLIDNGMKSASVKSYLSAIKKTLVVDGYQWVDTRVEVATLTRACCIINDTLMNRFGVHCGLLKLILFQIERKFSRQPYLLVLYQALFSLGYYGLLRAGELCINAGVPLEEQNTIKAKSVFVATNKEKIMLVLYTSKTHGLETHPQKIKITSNRMEKSGHYCHRHFCPFFLMRNYIRIRPAIESTTEPLFIFSDSTAVKSTHGQSSPQGYNSQSKTEC